jgi:hypothetical protein
MHFTHRAARRLGIVTAIAAGVVLGAIVGQPGSGRAAATAVPKNKTLPSISGLALVGQTLTATTGTWTNSPTSYHFAWSRCDATGAACLAIGGATARIYTVTVSDEGHTLRATVTAKNSSGSAAATSPATTVVPPSGCPVGTGTIQVADLQPPAQLEIVGGKTLHRVTRTSKSISIKFAITACGGRAVQGATVYAAAIPYNQFAVETATSAADGTVTLTEPARKGFPASPHQRLLAVFVRATKPGQPTVGGVSARRLVAFPIF